MKKFFTLLCVAFLAISVFAQTYNGGTWYSLYDYPNNQDDGYKNTDKTFDVFAPTTQTASFEWKKTGWFIGYPICTINKSESSNGGSSYSSETKIVDSGAGIEQSSWIGGQFEVGANINKLKITQSGSLTRHFKNVKLPLAKHILLSGGDFGKSSVSKTFTQETRIGKSSNIRADFRSFLTNGDISISLTEGDAEVFRLGAENNTTGVLSSSTAGKTYAVGANACASANGSAAACSAGQLGKIDNYSFQIYFCPKAVGEATGKITITDGTNTATISLKGTGIKMETLEVDVPLSVCQGSSVEYRGKTYTAATSEQINATGAIRDTVYNVTVTVLQPTTGTAEKTIVYGAEESWNGIDLSEYTVGSHEVEFKTTNVAGCDSTVTLTLTVNKQETLEVPVELSFCAGGSEYYRGVEYTEAGVFDVPAEGAVCDTLYKVNVVVLQPTTGTAEKTIVYGAEESWNGIDLSEYTVGSHEVEFKTTNVAGCDSTVTLTLTVNKQETLEVSVELSFCAGGSEEFRGVEYTEAGVFDVPAEGAVRDTLYKVNVIVLQPTTGTAEKTIVYGAEESWNGIDLSEYTVGSHEVEFKTTNVAGCDSTVTLTLTVKKQETLEVPVELNFCAGGSEEFRGVEYKEAGVFDVPAEGAVRDTLYKVNVIVLQPSFGNAEMEITVGDEVEWNGIALKDSTVGVHYVVFDTTNVAGCDSTVTLTLTVKKQETLEVPVELSFCAGGSEYYRGVEYTEAGVFDVPAEGAVRDTLYKVTVVVFEADREDLYETVKVGETIELGDQVWASKTHEEGVTGSYEVKEEDLGGLEFTLTLTNANGCDSVIVRHVTVEEAEKPETPTALDSVEAGTTAFKVLRDGVIYIRRGDSLYTIEGRKAE